MRKSILCLSLALLSCLSLPACDTRRSTHEPDPHDMEVPDTALPPWQAPDCPRIDFPLGSRHTGPITWDGTQFILQFEGADIERDADGRAIATTVIHGLEGYTPNGQLNWSRQLNTPLSGLWRQDDEVRVLAQDEDTLTLSRVSATGVLEAIQQYSIPGLDRYLKYWNPIPGPMKRVWLVAEDTGVLRLDPDGFLLLESTFERNGNQYSSRAGASVDHQGNLRLVINLSNYETNTHQGYLGTLIDDQWQLVPFGDDDLYIADIQPTAEGFLVSSTRAGPWQDYGIFSTRDSLGGRLHTLNANLEPVTVHDIERGLPCDLEHHDWQGQLFRTPTGWLSWGRMCSLGDTQTPWLLSLSPTGEVENEAFFQLNRENNARGIAISDEGVIAVSGDHRACCGDTISDGTPFLMFIDPELRCLTEGQPRR